MRSRVAHVAEPPAARPTAFYPIAGPRAFQEVIDQIAFAIRSGLYRRGDRLPTIHELAAAMRVSPPTVGEAIRVLAHEGVVRVHRGASGGTVVTSTDVPITLFRMSGAGLAIGLGELLEARRVIEMEIAVLAGSRASEQDLEFMQAAIDELAEARDWSDPQVVHQADHLFHYALGRAARNEMLAYAQHQVLVRQAELFNEYAGHDIEDTIATHRATLVAIRSRDQARIRLAMDEHLALVEGAEPTGIR